MDAGHALMYGTVLLSLPVAIMVGFLLYVDAQDEKRRERERAEKKVRKQEKKRLKKLALANASDQAKIQPQS